MDISIESAQEEAVHVLEKLTIEEYAPFLHIIEEYIKKNKLLVDSQTSYGKLYVVYAQDARMHAINLVDKLYLIDHDYSRYVEAKQYFTFNIFINMRQFVKIYALGEYKNTKVISLINPEMKDDFMVIPHEISLIQIYWDLYNPEKVDQWANIMRLESEFFHTKYQGGADNSKVPKVSQVYEILMGLPNCVLIGYHALEKADQFDRVQLISDNVKMAINNIKTMLTRLNLEFSMRPQNIRLPMDMRLEKFTFYARVRVFGKITEIPILDLYNSAEYELVPYELKNGIMVGHPYVICRFLLIDWWINRIKFASGEIKEKLYMERQARIYGTVREIRIANAPRNFFGIFKSSRLAEKMLKIPDRLNYAPAKKNV